MGHGQIDSRRLAALQAPPPPGHTMRARLEAQQVPNQVRAERPSWLSQMCAFRHLFQATCLRITFGGQSRVFKFLYAKQNPLTASFCAVAPLEVALYHGPAAAGPWADGLLCNGSTTSQPTLALAFRPMSLAMWMLLLWRS